jgi:hypothetical protein
MEYADTIYVYLLNLKPGERINVNDTKDPDRFVKTVKNLMDFWNLKGFEFNDDYSVLRRMNSFIQNKPYANSRNN